MHRDLALILKVCTERWREWRGEGGVLKLCVSAQVALVLCCERFAVHGNLSDETHNDTQLRAE